MLAIRSVLKLIFVDTLLGPHIHHFMRLLFILNDQLINVKCGSINCRPAIAAHADNFMFFSGSKKENCFKFTATARANDCEKVEFFVVVTEQV